MKLEMIVKDIKDPWIRENFVRIAKFFNNQPLFVPEFEFFIIDILAASTNYRFKHNLGYPPLDMFITSKIGAGVVTLNYDLFDNEFLDITTTGPARIRAFVGAYRGGA